MQRNKGEHLRIMYAFIDIQLAKANILANFVNSDFCHTTVEYLGHKAG